MADKTIYFQKDEDANAIMADIADIAAVHGYVNQRGTGSAPQLLAAIANGKVALWLPDSIDAMLRVAERLEAESDYSYDAFDSLSGTLRATVQRAIEADE